MKHFIIEKDGEQQVVKSLEGYGDCTVLGECDNPPAMWEEWCKKDKCFKKDEAKEKADARKCQARNPDALLDRIEALEALVADLSKRLNNKAS